MSDPTMLEQMAAGAMEDGAAMIAKLQEERALLWGALKLAALELTYVSEGNVKPVEIAKTLSTIIDALAKVTP